MKIIRPATPDEVAEIYRRLAGLGDNEGTGRKHSERCTWALCVCGYGAKDGTPTFRDYKDAGQYDTWCTPAFDIEAVLAVAARRMPEGWVRPHPNDWNPIVDDDGDVGHA